MALSNTIPIIKGTDPEAGSGNAFSPRFNLSYHPSSDSTLYAEVAKGFRAGALQDQASVGAVYKAFGVVMPASLGSDTLWNYEVGAKWRMFDRRLLFDLSLYTFNWSNAQFQYSPGGGIGGIFDVGTVHARGVDLSILYKTPIEGLTLQMAGNLNATHLKNVPASVTAAVPFLVDGIQTPGVPQSTLTVNADYTRPLSNGWSLLANARYLYRARQRDIATGISSGYLSEGFVRLGVDTGKSLQAFLFIDNLSNDRGPASIGDSNYIIPYPRTYGISLQGHF